MLGDKGRSSARPVYQSKAHQEHSECESDAAMEAFRGYNKQHELVVPWAEQDKHRYLAYQPHMHVECKALRGESSSSEGACMEMRILGDVLKIYSLARGATRTRALDSVKAYAWQLTRYLHLANTPEFGVKEMPPTQTIEHCWDVIHALSLTGVLGPL